MQELMMGFREAQTVTALITCGAVSILSGAADGVDCKALRIDCKETWGYGIVW